MASDNGACPADGGNNYPYRGGKFQSFEGGVHVPSFVWSGAMPSSIQGRTTDTLFHAVDWMPTLLTATGAINNVADLGGIDGMDLHEQVLHMKSSGQQRDQVLLRMNRWYMQDDHLGDFGFKDAYMAMVVKDGDTLYKVMMNEYKGFRIEPDHKAYNLSCFVSYGQPISHLYDLTNDPIEADNLHEVLADKMADYTRKLRDHY